MGDKPLKRVVTICVLAMATATMTFSASTLAAAVYYRWNDENGRPVHSDRPPPKGVDYEVISTGSKFIRPVDAEEGIVPLEVEPTASNDFEKVDTSESEFKKNPQICQRARDNLDALNTNARVRVRNDQGEIHYIDPEEHATQTKIAIETIELHCD